ncbi:LysE family translocator [Streptomyces sp. NPDC059853]|uniref:LysE family translocator n=1 Tax=Streptomyces sp. NPDC059853 TaxID=3346973 RepID=UPI00365FF8AB
MSASVIAAFWALSVLLVLVPGADWAYVITAGLRDRSVAPAVGGLLLGYAALTAVVAAGVGAVLAGSPALLTALTALGAAYLVWLGATALARPAAPAAEAGGEAPASRWAKVLKGAGISGLNPKALLLFVALLPQFTSRDSGWPLAVQLALLGLVHTVNCGAVYAGVGLTARAVLRSRPAAARAVSRLSGLAMATIGVLLLADHLTT